MGVFISYTWESPEHENWVKKLATDLRQDGVDAILDRWGVRPGESILRFTETAIRNNEYVLVICTPEYKRKADNRLGGAGYETEMIAAEIFSINSNSNKFIPVLRCGEWNEVAPTFLGARYYIDLRDCITSTKYEEEYRRLLDVLNNTWEEAPPVGIAPHKKGKVIDETKLQFTLDYLMGRAYKVGHTIKYGNSILMPERRVADISEWLTACMEHTRDNYWVSTLSRAEIDDALDGRVLENNGKIYRYNEDERREIIRMCAERLRFRLSNYAGNKDIEYKVMDNGDIGFRFQKK